MPRVSKDSEDSKSSGLSSEAVDSSPEAEVSTPRIHGLESHDLTAREQLMRQWPTWDWETR